MCRTLVLSPESEIRIEMAPGRYSIFMETVSIFVFEA